MHRIATVALIALVACTSRSAGDGAPPSSSASAGHVSTATPSARPPGPTIEVAGLDGLRHRPLIQLVERNPWLMVIGSDVPTFVLYEDGLVIFRKGDERRGEHMRADLGRAGAAALAGDIARSGFFDLPRSTSVAHATDQPTVQVLVRDGLRWHLASVYGIGRDGKALHGNEEAAPAFTRTYRRLVTFDAPKAAPWNPEQIEVMLGDFSYAGSSVPWPSAIPRPKAPIQAPANGVFKHFIDGKYEDDVRALQAKARDTTAVEIDGHKWSFGYRRCVPEEEYFYKVERAIFAAR